MCCSTCGFDMALTALRSDPEQNVPAAPTTMTPLPSVQLSSWLTLSSSSTIMLPEGRRAKKCKWNVIKEINGVFFSLCKIIPEKAFMREGLLMVSTAMPDSCLRRSMEPPGKACSFSLISFSLKLWMLELLLHLCSSLGDRLHTSFY